MRFEWDEEKKQANLQKHGLDFADAWEAFLFPILVALDDREEYGEDRWIGISTLRTCTLVVLYTERGEDIIRIISLRKALTHERKQYEQFLTDQLGKD